MAVTVRGGRHLQGMENKGRYSETLTADMTADLDYTGPMLTGFWRSAIEQLNEVARARGIVNGAVLISRTSLISLLAYVEAAGGEWRDISARPLMRMHANHSTRLAHLSAHNLWRERHPEALVGGQRRFVALTGALMEAQIGSEILLISSDEHVSAGGTLLVHGSSQDAVVGVFDAYERWLDGLNGVFRVWGGASPQMVPRSVPEEQLILPQRMKEELLAFVDQFSLLQNEAAELGVPVRRGMLLVGHPGSGKTQFIRHLRHRLPQAEFHLYLATDNKTRAELGFEAMLRAVSESGMPSVIVIEEIDRLNFSESVVTGEFLLNTLDGMLELQTPVLWVATTNYPDGLERNLLDRPGRFDRIFVFREPGPAERELMLRTFSAGRLNHVPEIGELVRASAGLYGSHLREASISAVLSNHASNSDFVTTLAGELARQKQHQENSGRYESLLRETRSVGFAQPPVVT